MNATTLASPDIHAALRERFEWILSMTTWSARELARRAGLKSESHVGLIMRGGSAKNETLEAIAHAAGVQPAWLILGSGEPFAPGVAPPPWATRPPTPDAPLSNPSVTHHVEPFPLELDRAIGRRRLLPQTLAVLEVTPKTGQSEHFWSIYIDAYEGVGRILELSEPVRDVGSSSSPDPDVVRSRARVTSRTT